MEEDSTVREAGDVIQIVLPVTALASTFIAKDRQGTWQLLKSFGFGFVSVHALKQANDKLRPDASNPRSFPSGHTFAAFSGASFIHTRYGAKVGIPALVAAGFVGYSRIDGQKHFLDDVIAGASITLLWNWRFVDRFDERISIEPMLMPDGYGVMMRASW